MERPYRITNANPLVVIREDAPVGTEAFLEDIGEHTRGRTDATRAGFDFHGTVVNPLSATQSGGGQNWTGLVYRERVAHLEKDGDVTDQMQTMRCAIELPAGRLSDPEEYTDCPWSWDHIRVHDGPIAPGPGTIGWEPPPRRPGAGAIRR